MSTTSPSDRPAAASPTTLPDFDPRQVPIAAVDIHLPAVPRAALTPEALRQRFVAPPQWEPEVVLEKSYASRSPARAAVLLGIVLRDEPMVLLTERTAHLSTHSGQVAFPGGRADPEDASPAHTALREAEEELGLIDARAGDGDHGQGMTRGSAAAADMAQKALAAGAGVVATAAGGVSAGAASTLLASSKARKLKREVMRGSRGAVWVNGE